MGAQQPRRVGAQRAGGLVAAAAAAPHGAGRGRARDAGLDHRGIRRRDAVGQLPRLGQDPGGGVRQRARPGRRAGRRGAHGGDADRRDRGIRADRPPRRPRRGADGADGTELVVVDYKTGRHLLSVDDARSSLALAIYALAAARALRRDCRRVELHHLPSGQVLAWEHTRGVAAAAPAAGRGHRRGVRRGGRADARPAAQGEVRRGVPAAAGPGLRLVRLPAQLPGRAGRRGGAPAVGRASPRLLGSARARPSSRTW